MDTHKMMRKHSKFQHQNNTLGAFLTVSESLNDANLCFNDAEYGAKKDMEYGNVQSAGR